MNATTHFQKLYAPFEFVFPLPSNRAFEVQMPERDFRALMLGALNDIDRNIGGASAARKPVFSSAAVTQTGAVLFDLTAGRIVSVFNGGPDAVTISFGDVNAIWGGGTDILYPGGLYETPREVIGKVTAICQTGTTASLNLTLF